MKKTLYVHIGRPKVGSTAIQRFLKGNSELLKSLGVLYPKAGQKENASHVLAEVLQPQQFPNLAELAGEFYSGLLKEVEASDCATVILSSESFCFVDPAKLAERIQPHFDVRIVCYVRRQDDVLVSSYIQELKDGSMLDEDAADLEDYLKNKERIRLLDYNHMLDQWAGVFGQENIIARVYEKGQLKGDLFGDILDVLGLSITDEFKKPAARVNQTPASDILELIKIINGYQASPFIKRQLKSRLTEISASLDYDPEFDLKRIFSPAWRARALAIFDDSNSEMARKYLARGDGILFRESPGDSGDEGAVSPLDSKYSMDRMAEIWIGMLAMQQRKIAQLERQLLRLSEALKVPEQED